MEYNIKLSKGKININGKEYDIPDEVAEFIIYETSTRDDIIQTRDVYEKTIDKAIEYIETCNPNVELHSELLDESYLSNYGANELLDILKGGKIND